MSASETLEFWKLFRPSACTLDLKADAPESIFDEILENMVKGKVLDEELVVGAKAALVQRERMASTGVGRSVAIPHVQIAGLEAAVVSLSIHRDGIEWSALDGAPAQIFFTVLRPARAGTKHDPERHIAMMRWIANLGRDDDFRRFSLAVKTRTELVDLLKEKSGA
jgi:PTS system fructose-specific IIA component/PTS system nitrogen regulatory IIA component